MSASASPSFRETFRGYDREQVDAALDGLRDQLDEARQSAVANAQEAEAATSDARDDVAAAEERIVAPQAELTEAKARAGAAESRAWAAVDEQRRERRARGGGPGRRRCHGGGCRWRASRGGAHREALIPASSIVPSALVEEAVRAGHRRSVTDVD